MKMSLTRLPGHWRWMAAGLIILLTSGYFVIRMFGSANGDWAVVRHDDLVVEVEISGTLKAVDSSTVGPPQISDVWDFKVAMLAREGSEVKKGQPVLAFDTSNLEQQRQTKSAERDSARKEIEKRETELKLSAHDDALTLAQAQANLRKAKLKLEGSSDAEAAKEVAKARLDAEIALKEVTNLTRKVELSRKVAEAELKALKDTEQRASARVLEIESAIGRMTVPAPRAGTVVYVSNYRGEKKKVGDQCWRAEQVLEIPDLSAMTAEGEADEADSGKLAEGQHVRFHLDAAPDIEYQGVVQTSSRTVQRKSWENPMKVVRLRINLERTDRERMRPGMRFQGKVETQRRKNALVVPADAIVPTSEGPVVYKKTPFGTSRTSVRLGERNSDLVEVKEGIKEGDEVIRRPNGMGVTP